MRNMGICIGGDVVEKHIFSPGLLSFSHLRDCGKKLSDSVKQWRIWGVMLTATGLLLLTGCVQYDLEVNFNSQTHGEIIQHIKIGERLTAFSNETARLWLESIKSRTRDLQGKTKKISEQELLVTIPFNNGNELADKINQFMNPGEPKSRKTKTQSELGLPEISSQMTVNQNNFIFVLRNRLTYDLDLRSLGVISADGNLLISPGALLNLEFALRTPWGAKIITDDSPDTITDLETEGFGDQTPTEFGDQTPTLNPVPVMTPESRDRGRTLVWTLEPGQLNHIEVMFWVPSPIGIGAAIIAVFIGLSMYVKNLLTPLSPSVTEVAATEPETTKPTTEATAIGQ
jgi:hypothetical protein